MALGWSCGLGKKPRNPHTRARGTCRFLFASYATVVRVNSEEEFWDRWSFKRSCQGALGGSGVVMVEVRRGVPLVTVGAGR